MLYSCKTQSKNTSILHGRYCYKKVTPFQRWYLQSRLKAKFYYTPALELSLFSDSTYVYKTCGGIEKGFYKIMGDSVILYITEFQKPKSDAVKLFNPPVKNAIYYNL